ncbi:MAG: formate/nitrite transporter family protein [Candidatus Aenigmatarchaeota archaeon]
MIKTPKDVAEEAVEVFASKATQSAKKIFILSFLAGVFIAFGAELSTIVSFDLRNFSLGFSRFLAGSVFSFGLMLVVLTGAELFTGNCLMVIPLLKGEITKKQFLKSWAIVYFGNFLGSLFFSFLIFFSGIYNNAIASYAVEIAANKTNLSFLEAFLRGVACNWLVALAVWLALTGSNMLEKMVGIYFPIMAFVASGFEHSIANMFFIPLGILLKDSVSVSIDIANLTLEGFFLRNLIPVTLGNIVGGAIFVGLIYWYIYLKEEIIL